MTAAFVLSINMFIAALFAVAFTVVASTNPTVRGARWLAAAYGIGVIDVALEFILPSLAQPTPVVVAIYVSYLAALTCGLIGVARHYGAALPRSATAIVWLAGLAFVPVMLGLPYGSALRTLLYQLPYAAMQVLMVAVVVRSGGKLALDRLLVVVGALAVLVYLAKPAIAWWIGTADHAQAYLASDYAAISQTMGSVVLIALALVLLLVIMRDTTMEMIARSETDPLSGALNRRGFETHGDRAVVRARRTDQPLSLITLDLDRFKAINDSFGHAAGDRVIADLAGLLDDTVGSDDLVARLGAKNSPSSCRGAPLRRPRLWPNGCVGRWRGTCRCGSTTRPRLPRRSAWLNCNSASGFRIFAAAPTWRFTKRKRPGATRSVPLHACGPSSPMLKRRNLPPHPTDWSNLSVKPAPGPRGAIPTGRYPIRALRRTAHASPPSSGGRHSRHRRD